MSLGVSKPKDLNRVAKFGWGKLCQIVIDHSFNKLHYLENNSQNQSTKWQQLSTKQYTEN
jgi:hypothetical protein